MTAPLAGKEPAAAAVDPEDLARATLRVNGRTVRMLVEPRWSLLYVLREQLGLTGTKVACNRGMCGTCTVLLDGKTVYSCHTLALDAHGKQVLTVEGLMKGEELSPLQQAFVDEDGLQCGYCTPGMLVALEGLRRRNPKPDAGQIAFVVVLAVVLIVSLRAGRGVKTDTDFALSGRQASAADVAWVGPLRDGMNLVAKEYIAWVAEGGWFWRCMRPFARSAIALDAASAG